MTMKGLGAAIGYSESYVSKVETAVVVPSARFAEGCDRAFGTGTLIARQYRLAVNGEHPSWFVPYIQLERCANKILDYSTLFVMGMLQTKEYARAVFRSGTRKETAEVVEAKVLARIRRHELLERDTPAPPLLWVVLHEACLRVNVGGPDVMRRQLEHLVREAESPQVTIQLLPFGVGPPATGNAFTLLFTEGRPTVLHTEGPQGGRPYEAEKIVANGIAAYDRLRADALGLEASIARIKDISKEYTS